MKLKKKRKNHFHYSFRPKLFLENSVVAHDYSIFVSQIWKIGKTFFSSIRTTIIIRLSVIIIIEMNEWMKKIEISFFSFRTHTIAFQTRKKRRKLIAFKKKKKFSVSSLGFICQIFIPDIFFIQTIKHTAQTQDKPNNRPNNNEIVNIVNLERKKMGKNFIKYL